MEEIQCSLYGVRQVTTYFETDREDYNTKTAEYLVWRRVTCSSVFFTSEIVLLGHFDFGDLENTPIQTWLTQKIITWLNGKEAYRSKDEKWWDLRPSENTQVSIPSRNVIRIRVGCVARCAKNATTPIEAWNIFMTDQMINDITGYTNVFINENKVF